MMIFCLGGDLERCVFCVFVLSKMNQYWIARYIGFLSEIGMTSTNGK